MSYNGWTNYETWAVFLWYGDTFVDDEQTQAMVYEAADREGFVYDWIMEYPPADLDGFFRDIVGHAMRRVNWTEVVDAILEDYEPKEEDE